MIFKQQISTYYGQYMVIDYKILRKLFIYVLFMFYLVLISLILIKKLKY